MFDKFWNLFPLRFDIKDLGALVRKLVDFLRTLSFVSD